MLHLKLQHVSKREFLRQDFSLTSYNCRKASACQVADQTRALVSFSRSPFEVTSAQFSSWRHREAMEGVIDGTLRPTIDHEKL